MSESSLFRGLTRQRLVDTLLVWLPFLLLCMWGLRFNVLTELARFGDALEVVWGANWYAGALREGYWPLSTEIVFFPSGWPTSLLAHTPLFLLAMGFARLVMGEAAVFNLFFVGSFAVAYAGMLRVLTIHVQTRWIILLAALLMTFSGMRWVRYGHLNVLWMSAFLVWFFWVLQSDLKGRQKIVLGALFWALTVVASLYGIWLGAVVLLAFLVSKFTVERLRIALGLSLLTGVLSLPTIVPFWIARHETASRFFDIQHISEWGASLNSLVLPPMYHPWLRSLLRQIYPVTINEADVANFGIIASVLGIGMLFFLNYRDWRQRQVVVVFALGILLALGPVLRWSRQSVAAESLATLDAQLWTWGQLLKPQVFPAAKEAFLRDVVPLPGYLFYLLVPFAEGARTAMRFAFVAGLGFFVLVAMALERIWGRYSWLAIGLAILLLFELTPNYYAAGADLASIQHEAYEWLSETRETRPGAIMDLVAHDRHLALNVSGATLYATDYHGRPTAGGVSTMWPDSAWQLHEWLLAQDNPLESDELGAWLDAYQIAFVVIEVQTPQRLDAISAVVNSRLELVECFESQNIPTPWPNSICVFETLPVVLPFDLIVGSGWSVEEPWGRWAETNEASGKFVAAESQDILLTLEAFPHCIQDHRQTIEFVVNGRSVDQLAFVECETVLHSVAIPADFIRSGWNELVLEFNYAIAPSDATNGANPDPRTLSVGVKTLNLEPVSP